MACAIKKRWERVGNYKPYTEASRRQKEVAVVPLMLAQRPYFTSNERKSAHLVQGKQIQQNEYQGGCVCLKNAAATPVEFTYVVLRNQ